MQKSIGKNPIYFSKIIAVSDLYWSTGHLVQQENLRKKPTQLPTRNKKNDNTIKGFLFLLSLFLHYSQPRAIFSTLLKPAISPLFWTQNTHKKYQTDRTMNSNQALLGSALVILFFIQLAVAVPPFLFDGYGSEGKTEKKISDFVISYFIS